jgi:hypothetical protein
LIAKKLIIQISSWTAFAFNQTLVKSSPDRIYNAMDIVTNSLFHILAHLTIFFDLLQWELILLQQELVLSGAAV